MKLFIPHKEALVLILLLVESWNLAGNAILSLSLCLPSLAISLILLVETSSPDCYDPLDPNGNITVTFDIYQWTDDGYMARVTIQNYYQFRQVEMPGWSLGWSWAQEEIIWSMAGAFATQQGNCSTFKSRIPHSCKREPIIIDLTPDAAPENRTAHCCRNGVLSSWAIDQPTSFSSFDVVVGGLDAKANPRKPQNLTLLAPRRGYTCGPLEDDTPTVVPVGGGRREEQVFCKTSRQMIAHNSHIERFFLITFLKCLVCCEHNSLEGLMETPLLVGSDMEISMHLLYICGERGTDLLCLAVSILQL